MIWVEVLTVCKFHSGRFEGTRGDKDDGFRNVNGFTTKLHEGRQGKHIIGHNNFVAGKSVLHMSMKRAQELVEAYAGTGTRVASSNKERIDFGYTIGTYVDRNGNRYATTVGNIHYSQNGAHIVPARPRKDER